MIKILDSKSMYFESEQKIELKINGKKITVFRYEKKDPENSDYELTVGINDRYILTTEEIQEIEEELSV